MPNMLYPKIHNLGATGSNPVGCTIPVFGLVRSRRASNRQPRERSWRNEQHRGHVSVLKPIVLARQGEPNWTLTIFAMHFDAKQKLKFFDLPQP